MEKTLGQLLREARERRGFTQKEASLAAFGTETYHSLISRWESDAVDPTTLNLFALALALNLSLGDFSSVATERKSA